MQKEYTKESIDYLKNTDIEKRKNLGQYFTPKSIRDLLLKKLIDISSKKDNVKIKFYKNMKKVLLHCMKVIKLN